MRLFIPVFVAITSVAPSAVASDTDIAKARLLEREGDSIGARQVLQKSAVASDPQGVLAYADFLDRHREPEARKVYESVLPNLSGPKANRVARRLIDLDLVAGDQAAASKHYETYKASGGGDITASVLQPM